MFICEPQASWHLIHQSAPPPIDASKSPNPFSSFAININTSRERALRPRRIHCLRRTGKMTENLQGRNKD